MNKQQALIGKLQKKRMIVKTKKRGFHKGSRQSRKYGSSLEFSDFRAYQPGDDVRLIDWNVYGRTNKHYIKRYLDEQELSIAIYLDTTSSMREIESKWLLAKQLAAAFSYMVLNSEDRLYFSTVSSAGVEPVKRKGSVYSRKTFLEILKLEEAGQAGKFINHLTKTVAKKQQLAIIITDGLESLEEIEALFKKMASFKQEIWFIQVLSIREIKPQFTGDMKLIDSETNKEVNVSMNPTIIVEYEKRLAEHNRKLEEMCRRFGGHYLLACDNRDIQSIIFHECRGKGLIN